MVPIGSVRIALAVTDDDIAATYAVMSQLRPHIVATDFVARIRRMETQGFRLAYLSSQDGSVAAVAGFRILDQLVSGRVLYVDDLVTDERLRSQGHGAALLDWLREYARTEACTYVELDSGTWRKDAHRFYERHGMSIIAYHFRTVDPL